MKVSKGYKTLQHPNKNIFYLWRLLEWCCFAKEPCGIVVFNGSNLFECFENISTYKPTKRAAKIRKRSIALTFCTCSMLKWWNQVEEPWGIVAWLACLSSLKNTSTTKMKETNIKIRKHWVRKKLKDLLMQYIEMVNSTRHNAIEIIQ